MSLSLEHRVKQVEERLVEFTGELQAAIAESIHECKRLSDFIRDSNPELAQKYEAGLIDQPLPPMSHLPKFPMCLRELGIKPPSPENGEPR